MTSGGGLSQSIQTRLIQHAKHVGVDPNLILTRYAIERLLYRLSRSEHAEQFILKGALLLLVWLGEGLRPTRDVDLLGFGDLSDDALAQVFRDLCALKVEADAMTYLADTISVATIRLDDAYGGRRVTLSSRLGNARLKVQVDVGIGDAINPAPTWLDYPSLLGLPQPRIRAYTPETVVAEKFHAMVLLGMRNTRMKDFFDVSVLARRMPFELETLAGSIRATFDRRETPVPQEPPLALSATFRQSAEKQQQWSAFVRNNGIEDIDTKFDDAVQIIGDLLGPVIESPRISRAPIRAQWPPGGPWRHRT